MSRVLNQAQYKRKVIFDLTIVSLVFLTAYAISSYFSLSERFTAWASDYEEIAEIDELPFALLSSLFAMIWFATKRIAESNDLIMRNAALIQRVIEVQEAERKAIAQNLHDDLGQYLNAIKAEAASLCIGEDVNSDTTSTARRITLNTNHAYSATKLMMRTLRPVGLDELGLTAAIEHLVDQWNVTLQKKTQFNLKIQGYIDDLSESMNIAIFRIVQEALTNVAKHAKANSVHIQLSSTANHLHIEISDNGIGFNSDSSKNGYGILGMYERAEALQGRLEISSTPQQGTRLIATIPIH